MSGRIDIHTHLIPGVDDGCKSLEESLACARQLAWAGFTCAFCTPHVLPQFPGNNAVQIAAQTHQLQTQLRRNQIPLEVLPGGEVSLGPHLIETPPTELVTLALNNHYLLCDFWTSEEPPFLKSVIHRLTGLGLRIILAHPERLEWLQKDPPAVELLQELGLLLQGNLKGLVEATDSPVRRLIERYLAEDRYFALATDTHELEFLSQRLEGLTRGLELLGRQKLDELTIANPAKVLPRSAFD